MSIHPFVRDLYKRAIYVGRDYPLGLDYVRQAWKKALRDPANCPSCYRSTTPASSLECEREIRLAVGRGRFMVREMIGIIQLNKYRTMKKRYGAAPLELTQRMNDLEQRASTPIEYKKKKAIHRNV